MDFEILSKEKGPWVTLDHKKLSLEGTENGRRSKVYGKLEVADSFIYFDSTDAAFEVILLRDYSLYFVSDICKAQITFWISHWSNLSIIN